MQNAFDFTESAPRVQGPAKAQLEAVIKATPGQIEKRIASSDKAKAVYKQLRVVEHDGKTSIIGNSDLVARFLEIVIVAMRYNWLSQVKRVKHD